MRAAGDESRRYALMDQKVLGGAFGAAGGAVAFGGIIKGIEDHQSHDASA